MWRYALLAGLCLCVAGGANARVYKCGGEVRPVYSDRPCEDANGHLLMDNGLATAPEQELKKTRGSKKGRKATPAPPPLSEEELRRQADEEFIARVTLQRRADKGEVGVGMDASMVRKAWGDPETVSRGENTKGRWEKWAYEREGWRKQVDLVEGQVVRISERPLAKRKKSGKSSRKHRSD